MKKTLLITIFLALFLCSCSHIITDEAQSTEVTEIVETEKSNEDLEESPNDEHTSDKYANWKLAHKNDLFCSDTGIYEAKQVFPDSVSLMFLDYASNIETFLCPNPNCAHNDESCPSYYPYSDYYPPTLIVANDTIYLIDYGNGETSLPRIVKRDNTTGSFSFLFQFDANQSIGSKIYADGNYLAFCMKTSEEARSFVDIVTLDLSTGESSILYRFDTEDYIELNSAYADTLLFMQISMEKPELCTYYSFNPNSDNEPKEFYQHNTQTESVVFTDKFMYSLESHSDTVCRKDLSTEEQIQLEIPLSDNQSLDLIQDVLDEYLYVTRVTENADGTKSAEKIFCDFNHCDTNAINLKNSYNNSAITVVSQYGDTLYVINDFTIKDTYITTPQGQQYITAVFNQYAAISLDDFKSSIPNYIKIDSIY